MDHWSEYYTSQVLNNEKTDLLSQVGKTVNGKNVDKIHVYRIIETILELLQPDNSSFILDFGCGNGLLTRMVAEKCGHIVGVDRSEELLEIARQYSNRENIQYLLGDILDYTDKRIFDGIYCYEVIQHIEKDDLHIVLNSIKNLLGKKGRCFLGGIPDIECLREFYNTDEKMKYHLKCEKEKKPHLGIWYSREELITSALKAGLEASVLDQNVDLYTSHYRFDVVLRHVV